MGVQEQKLKMHLRFVILWFFSQKYIKKFITWSILNRLTPRFHHLIKKRGERREREREERERRERGERGESEERERRERGEREATARRE